MHEHGTLTVLFIMSHSANHLGRNSSAFIANNASERCETTLRVLPGLRLTSTTAPPPLNLGDLAALSPRPLQLSDPTQKRKEPQHYARATAPSPNHATAHAVNNSTSISHNFARRTPSDEMQENTSTPTESEATRRNTGRRTGRGNGQGGRYSEKLLMLGLGITCLSLAAYVITRIVKNVALDLTIVELH